MSTKGVYGFKINNEYKLFMSLHDSYPENLGNKVVDFIKKTNKERLIKHVRDLNEYKLQDVKKIKNKTQFLNKVQNIDFWSDVNDVLSLLEKGLLSYFNNAVHFMNNHIACDYAYVFNLDKDKFEVFIYGNFQVYECDINNIPKNWKHWVNLEKEKHKDKIEQHMIKLLEYQAF